MGHRVGWLVCVVVLGLGSVAASAKSYVVGMRNAEGSDNLYYRVGLITDMRTIDWGVEAKMDAPIKGASVATDKGIAVLVFEKDKYIFYRVGKVDRKALSVAWGPALEFSKGRRPEVAINGGACVVTHLGKDKDRVFTLVGEVKGERLQVAWGEAQEFIDKGRRPLVGMGGEN